MLILIAINLLPTIFKIFMVNKKLPNSIRTAKEALTKDRAGIIGKTCR
jgi:uncharacterized protein (UPF0216 family)